ncbi:MAG: coproporphyrinogen III oxidase [Proteobacteria bacterium]|nr:coproporphyrinogen III oxidase [Pseudomonadota bacterium]
MSANGGNGGDAFGVYIHWPFCASKCPYCDFNSHVRRSIDEDAWRSAYVREIGHYARLTPGRTVTSIFFGGGTPSLMDPRTAQAVIDAVAGHWMLAPDVEITLEANPTSVEAEKFTAFRAAGVNRVSVGVQALNDEDLKFLGRQHNAQEALSAIEMARRCFDRHSFDLIYARPGMTVEKWRHELTAALSYAGGHLSLYQLTIEEGTPFYMRHARGEFSVPDDENGGALYEATQEIMDAVGMPAYEVSNHAAPGQESRHNLTYWRYGDYAGIGPGAHGRLTLEGMKYAARGHRAPEIWLERVDKEGHGAHPFEAVTGRQEFTECLMMGLRLRGGMQLPSDWREYIEEKKMRALMQEGLLAVANDNLRLTPAGMQRLNGVLSYLL